MVIYTEIPRFPALHKLSMVVNFCNLTTQVDQKIKAILGYTVDLWLAWDMRVPVSEKQNKVNKTNQSTNKHL